MTENIYNMTSVTRQWLRTTDNLYYDARATLEVPGRGLQTDAMNVAVHYHIINYDTNHAYYEYTMVQKRRL